MCPFRQMCFSVSTDRPWMLRYILYYFTRGLSYFLSWGTVKLLGDEVDMKIPKKMKTGKWAHFLHVFKCPQDTNLQLKFWVCAENTGFEDFDNKEILLPSWAKGNENAMWTSYFKGVLHLLPRLAKFVFYLKIINTFLKHNIYKRT